MPPKLKFQEGEKVLCYHGPLIYEAKCLESMIVKDQPTKYKIHYAGWNKNWDEWVPETRVLKYNDANVQRQKEIQKSYKQNQGIKNKKSGSSTKNPPRKSDVAPKESSSRATTPVSVPEKSTGRSSKLSSSALTPTHEQPSEPMRKKRGREAASDKGEDSEVKIDLKMTLSDELKYILLDENECIKQRKLAVLPSKKTVNDTLDDYLKWKMSTSNDIEMEGAIELAKGIKHYFNVSLGSRLLYKWERPQFEEIMSKNEDSAPSEIYGAFHLLRLFVKLGGMLAESMTLDEKSTHLLQKHFCNILEYIHEKRNNLFDFNSYYSDSTPEYYRKFMQH